MNLLKSSVVFASFLLVAAAACQAQYPFKSGKAVSKFTKDLVSVPLGSFTMGRTAYYKYAENDSMLFRGDYVRLVEMNQPYYISDHEVTNAEYKEFVNWVIASTQIDYNKRNDQSLFTEGKIDYKKLTYTYPTTDGQKTVTVYPDTAVWTNDFKYSYNEPMTRLYYKHDAYANYPVVGVSWEQANAYCDWRTNRTNDLIKSDNPGQTGVIFRLPTESEWEYAALGTINFDKKRAEAKEGDKIKNEIRIFPWEGSKLTNEKGKYYANFGMVKDQNELVMKSYLEDGAFHTAPIQSYPCNAFKLHDMAGNVAEWVADEPQLIQRKDTLGNIVKIDTEDNEENIISKLSSMANDEGKPIAGNPNSPDGKIRLMSQVRFIQHDMGVWKGNPNARIVKGGSWATGAVFMQCGAKEILSENKGSSRIGFRVVMTVENKPQSAEQ